MTSPQDINAQIDSLIAAGALFVANHSGGKDSQAQLIRLLERVPAKQMIVVHASLGGIRNLRSSNHVWYVPRWSRPLRQQHANGPE